MSRTLTQQINTHFEMLMSKELQQEIGCDDTNSRDMQLRVMRVIGRCSDQADTIKRLKEVLFVVGEFAAIRWAETVVGVVDHELAGFKMEKSEYRELRKELLVALKRKD